MLLNLPKLQGDYKYPGYLKTLTIKGSPPLRCKYMYLADNKKVLTLYNPSMDCILNTVANFFFILVHVGTVYMAIAYINGLLDSIFYFSWWRLNNRRIIVKNLIWLICHTVSNLPMKSKMMLV